VGSVIGSFSDIVCNAAQRDCSCLTFMPAKEYIHVFAAHLCAVRYMLCSSGWTHSFVMFCRSSPEDSKKRKKRDRSISRHRSHKRRSRSRDRYSTVRCLHFALLYRYARTHLCTHVHASAWIESGICGVEQQLFARVSHGLVRPASRACFWMDPCVKGASGLACVFRLLPRA
jgi:hypothetical protein